MTCSCEEYRDDAEWFDTRGYCEHCDTEEAGLMYWIDGHLMCWPCRVDTHFWGVQNAGRSAFANVLETAERGSNR